MYILNKCVDRSRLHKDQTVQHLCNKLSTDETPGSCVSLIPYLCKSILSLFCYCMEAVMVVGFKTTYAIGAYHHLRCESESPSDEVYSIQHYVMKFVSDL